MQLKVKRLSETAVLPARATDGSAGFDLCADISAPRHVLPHHTVKIGTGIAIELWDSSVVGLVYIRSGLSTKHGLRLTNCVGVIDSDYRGEIVIALHNSSEKAYIIEQNERIAQLVITPIVLPDIIEADELGSTERSDGGFGSTGR